MIPVSRLVPEQPYVLGEATRLGKDVVPAGTILVGIDEHPLTACEMVRPMGHESFACFVDEDRDGRFEGTYRSFSPSYFMLAAWSNRLPEPIAPVSYHRSEAETLPDYIELALVRGERKGDRWTFIVRPQSRQRGDGWVNAGQLVVAPENVGRRANIRGTEVLLKAVDENGVTVDVLPPATAGEARFSVQKNFYKPMGNKTIPWK